MKIKQFSGKYRFLSNFKPVEVELNGIHYASVEHGYQALKATNVEDHNMVASQPTAGLAKKAGRSIKVRPDWDSIKLSVMEKLVRSKFRWSVMADMLLDTGTAELIEGNNWNDTYWGVCRGVGENHLGKILMKVRRLLYLGEL
jgi:ribA/ribD-fused uncharacterized protein